MPVASIGLSLARLLASGSPWMSAALSGPATVPGPRDPNFFIAQGDAHYARREQGHRGDLADSQPILAAITAYESAAKTPDNAESRWKLARALYYRGAYTGLSSSSRQAVFEEARKVSQEAIAILGNRARGTSGLDDRSPAKISEAVRADPDAAPTFFWAAVAWGEWSLSVGKLQAARMGAAAKIRDDAMVLIALNPRFEEGGGHRILGRLHDIAPRIPLLTWWVSRKEALANLRRAVSIAPENLVNLHFLAEALARGNPAERTEAIRTEQRVLDSTPSPSHLVEELHIQEEARRNLREWKR